MAVAAKVLGLFIFVRLVSAQAVEHPNLNSPLSSLLSRSEQIAFDAFLVENCSETSMTVAFPVELFLTKSFYASCVEKTSPRASLFTYVSEFERKLREKLAQWWVTLNMSDEEIQLVKRVPYNINFKPLKFVNFEPVGWHVKHRYKFLEESGIFLVHDFLKAYQHELSLPNGPRFDRVRSLGRKSILDLKYGIEADLQRNGVVIAQKANQDVKLWLEDTKAKYLTNQKISEACNVLLHLIANTPDPAN